MKKLILVFSLLLSVVAGARSFVFVKASNSFAPTSLVNLEFWADTINSTVTQSGNVSNMTDLSGHSRAVAQATGALQPSWLTGGSGINGKNALGMTDATGRQLVTSGNFPISGDITTTITAVVQLLDTASAYGVLGWGDYLGTATNFGIYSLPAGNWIVPYANGNNYITDVAATTSPIVITVKKTPGAINATTIVRINGVQTGVSSASSNTPNITSLPLSLGRWGASYVTDWPKVKIGALAVYSDGKTNTEMTQVEQYFNALFGNIY